MPTTNPPHKIKLGEEAAAYFERRDDWPACSEALDGCQFVSTAIGTLEQAQTFALRRLDLPNLPAHEYGDVLSVVVRSYWYLGNPDQAIGIVEQALANLKPGQPIVHLAPAIAETIRVACQSGRWSTVEKLQPLLEEAYEQSLHSPQDVIFSVDGFFHILFVALAREDQPAIDRISSIAQRLVSSIPALVPIVQNILAMEIADDPGKLTLTPSQLGPQSYGVVTFLNQRGITSSPELIAQAQKMLFARSELSLTVDIAQALAANDNAALARLIDELATRHQFVLAARMRIVLAQRTGDRSQLERARPLLEELQDRRFLRRLEEVEAALASPNV